MLTRGGSIGALDVEAGLALLDRSVEELGAALALEEPTSEEALRLRRLKDEVASHALAASVLLTSGASPDSVRPVLVRAAALLSAERQGVPLRG